MPIYACTAHKRDEGGIGSIGSWMTRVTEYTTLSGVKALNTLRLRFAGKEFWEGGEGMHKILRWERGGERGHLEAPERLQLK
jgi:hypothetical protein